jgi:signal transduction histidine kinase
MKKILKLTLFKKIFLIILLGFLAVEAINIYLDYQNNINATVRSSIGEKDIENLELLCETVYHSDKSIQDKDIIELYQKTLKKDYGYNIIYDENHNIIYEKFSQESLNKQPYLTIVEENAMLYGVQTLIDISKLTQNQIEEIDNIILKADNQRVSVSVMGDIEEVKSKDDLSSESLEAVIIHPQYLNINNHLIIDNQERYDSQNYILETYCSQKIEYQWSSSKERALLKEFDKIKQQCQNVVKNSIEYGAIGNVRLNYKSIGQDLYIVKSVYVTDELGKSRYIFAQVNYLLNITHEILESSIISKRLIYSMAFVVSVCISLFISYMITNRIKKIDRITSKIANNHFDVFLKETPHDELGNLSKNINSMSKQLKETIQHLYQEINRVKELENLRKDFINQFTHEMKTPLGIINGYSELIDETDNDEEREKYLNIINRETTKINELIQSMLRLSRLEAGKVILQEEILDLEDLITEVVDEYEILYMQKKIQVEIIVKDKKICADKIQIKTVIHNFLSNAIKHTYENGKIVITIDRGLFIYNDGKQITDDQIEKIWYTFVTHDCEGSGLGLAICQSILELHHFNYGVHNKENGVEFYFQEKL